MLKTCFLALLIICTYPVTAQEFHTTYFGETEGGDYLPGYIAGVPDGGAFIAGQTNRADSGGYHVLLIRTDAQGARLWEQTYHAGRGAWVATTPDGGCVLGGYSLRHPFGTEQGFVSKIDALGTMEWTQYFPQGNHSEIQEVKPLANGDYAVCGIVSQPDSTGQNVFLARLAGDGGLELYEEIALEGVDNNPSVIETNQAQLVLSWERIGGGRIRSYQPNGTLNWEKNLLDMGFESVRPGVIQDATGDLWVTGLYQYEIGSDVQYYLLRLVDQNGSIKQQIPTIYLGYLGRPTAGRVEPDGTLILCGMYGPRFYCLRYDIQGLEVDRDSITFSSFLRSTNIDLNIPDKILWLQSETLVSQNGKIRVFPIALTSTDLTVEPQWELSVDNPFNHEAFEAKATAINGGNFVLFLRKSPPGAGYLLESYLMKQEPNGQIIGPVFQGNEPLNFTLNGQIQSTKDGGGIVLGEHGNIWKFDSNLQTIWTKQSIYGRLYTAGDNDFFIVENKTQPDPFDPILIHHFHADGQLDKTLEVYSKSQPYYVAGGVSQLNNGPVLFGVKYDDAGTPRNWIIYIDREGNLASEQLLSEQYSPLLLNFRNKFIQTSDGGALAASPSGDRIYMLKVKDGKVVWDASFVNGTPEEATMQLLDIEEVPCQGYVLSVLTNAYQSNAPSITPESTQTILLYHLDEHGHGQKTFSYRPLPEPSSPNTDFIPGYTYRRWGDRLNGQTYDLLLETVHFPDSLAMRQPAGALSIMPNPSPVETCLEYHSDDYGLMEIQVFNAAGVLMDHFYSRKTEAIWRQHYRLQAPKGTYFIRTRLNDQDWVSRRWVKMH